MASNSFAQKIMSIQSAAKTLKDVIRTSVFACLFLNTGGKILSSLIEPAKCVSIARR